MEALSGPPLTASLCRPKTRNMSSSVPRPESGSTRIREAAAIVARHRIGCIPLGTLPDAVRPRNEHEAYEVQRAVRAALENAGAGRRTGWKVGCTNPNMQEYLGVDHPCSGGVLDSTTHDGQGHFRHADYVRPGVECEIAVRLGRTLRAEEGPFGLNDVASVISEVMAAIEIVDDRYENRDALDVPTLVADDFFNAGCVLGKPFPPSQDLTAIEGEFRIDGKTVDRGKGGNLLGNPLEVLAWLASHPNATGGVLEEGTFVLLGSVTAVHWIKPDTIVEVSFEDLGTVRASFTPEGVEYE